MLFESGQLACEVCGFDFAAVYGLLGEGFAECHHTLPLGLATGERRTRLSDLAVVCANCHWMLHRRPWHTIPELRELLRSRRGGQPERRTNRYSRPGGHDGFSRYFAHPGRPAAELCRSATEGS